MSWQPIRILQMFGLVFFFFAAVSPHVLCRQVGGSCRSWCGALTSGCRFAPFSRRVSR